MEQIFKIIFRHDEFEKDFKRLSRKFRSLEEDLENLVKHQLQLFHKLGVDNRGIFQLKDLSFREPKVYKVKKFPCKALKGRGANSGIRIIYAYFSELDKIEFIEIYFKADQANEDRKRIERIYK